MNGKKILVLAGLGIFGAVAFGSKKVSDVSTIAKQLEIGIHKVRRIKGVSSWSLKAVIDVFIKNPTESTLNLNTGGIITLKRILVYNKANQLIAEASTDLDRITVPSKGQYVVENIPIKAELLGVIKTLLSSNFSLDPEDYTVYAEFEALGRKFTV